MSVDIHDVITCASFCDDRLRGLGVARGRISRFPIDLRRRPYNTVALPCKCVMYIGITSYGALGHMPRLELSHICTNLAISTYTYLHSAVVMTSFFHFIILKCLCMNFCVSSAWFCRRRRLHEAQCLCPVAHAIYYEEGRVGEEFISCLSLLWFLFLL